MNNLTGHTGNNGAATGGSNGDFMDKALDTAATKSGHTQKHSTIEKASDGLKAGIQKLTGKAVPGGDKEFK